MAGTARSFAVHGAGGFHSGGGFHGGAAVLSEAGPTAAALTVADGGIISVAPLISIAGFHFWRTSPLVICSYHRR
jgi:hypothetical protein